MTTEQEQAALQRIFLAIGIKARTILVSSWTDLDREDRERLETIIRLTKEGLTTRSLVLPPTNADVPRAS